MDYLLAVFAGAIQGLTEFLPISSSGHLVIFHDILNFNLSDNLLFDVVLHLGTALALVVFFYTDIINLIKGFLSSLVNHNLKNDLNQRLAWLIIIGTIPAGLVGYFFEDIITGYFHQVWVVGVMLIVVAILFFIIEKYSVKLRKIDQLSKLDAFIIGLAQMIALIPGTSRSGITIVTGMAMKMNREQAARFSFLLSIPIVLGAGLKQLMSTDWSAQTDIPLLIIGFISSALIGYFVINFLLKFLTNHSLNIFAWYRLTIGCLILIWFFLFRGL